VQMGCAGCRWGVLGAGGVCWVQVACAGCRWGVLGAGGVYCMQVGCAVCRWGVLHADVVCWVQVGRHTQAGMRIIVIIIIKSSPCLGIVNMSCWPLTVRLYIVVEVVY
jgi:hypothetical protein